MLWTMDADDEKPANLISLTRGVSQPPTTESPSRSPCLLSISIVETSPSHTEFLPESGNVGEGDEKVKEHG